MKKVYSSSNFRQLSKNILQFITTTETDTAQMEITECPVLYPTWKEFKNFYQFVEKADKLYKKDYGMVKVVPPPQWRPRTQWSYDTLDNLIVQGPIQQNISGKGGIYECLHIQKKSLTLKQYKLKTGVFDKITDKLSSQQVQKLFWKNIAFSPPLYGADLLNTLMDQKAGPWNMNHLSSILQHSMDTKVKGVNTPYCYIGSWKTLFCWHKEDLDLSAMNYLHYGKSKFWYSVPASQGELLQKEAIKAFPQHFKRCSQFLRHKMTLINPYILKQRCPQLKISKIQHKKNQFILVFGGAYHCGFNFGFNIAQAVNYGTLDWLTQLIDSKPCKCSKSSVKASHIQIYKNIEKTQFKNTKQFNIFKEKLFKELEEEEEEDDSQEIKMLKSEFSRKIKKAKKAPKKLKFKGEDYEIDNWVQCDHCQLWRKTTLPLRAKDRFTCKNAGKKCNQREKIQKNLITL